MPSVDDLVIQLRIDEGSNLGKLKKQLDALVGPEGKGRGAGMGGTSPGIIKKLDFIKSRMMYLTSVQIPGDPTGLKSEAGTFALNLQRREMQESLKVKFNKDDDWIEHIMRTILKIAEGTIGGSQGRNILDWLQKAMYSSGREVGEGWEKSLITNLEKAIGEAQSEYVKMFRKAGMTVVEFLKSYLIDNESLKEGRAKIDDYLDDLLQKTEGSVEHLKELEEHIDAKDLLPLDLLKQTADMLNLDLTPTLLQSKDYVDEIEDKAKKVAQTVFIIQQTLDNSKWMLEGQYNLVKKIYGPGLERTAKETDVTIIKGQEKLEEIYKELGEFFKDKIANFEIKAVAGLNDMKQAIAEQEEFGKTALLAPKIIDSVKTALAEMGIPTVEQSAEAMGGALDVLETNIGERIEKIRENAESETVLLARGQEKLQESLKRLLEQGVGLKDLYETVDFTLADLVNKLDLSKEPTAQSAPKPSD